MSHRVFALALILASLLPGASVAVADSKMDKATEQAAAESGSAMVAEPSPGSAEAIAMPTAPAAAILANPETRRQYLTAMQRYYEYKADGYAYRSRVFEWQLLSSRLIFFVVLALVGAGLYFAAVQFRLAMRAAPDKSGAPAQPAAGSATSLATNLEISAKGVVMSSSVMGVIILGLSLAFFYLYLAYVYPIKNVF